MRNNVSFVAGLVSAALIFTYFGGGVKAASSLTASPMTDASRVAALEQKVRSIESLLAIRDMPGNLPEHVSLERGSHHHRKWKASHPPSVLAQDLMQGYFKYLN